MGRIVLDYVLVLKLLLISQTMGVRPGQPIVHLCLAVSLRSTGIRPVGVVEMRRHIFANIVFKVTGPEATVECQDDQLCVGLRVEINGTIHGVQAVWYKNSTTEEWGFLLIDANITFNEFNLVVMLWTVRHLWLSGAHFAFNCYCSWSSLVLQNGNGTASILHSREGVTQEYPIEMIVYMIGILPLINNLKQETPDVTHPWYADNSGASGTFARLKTYFDLLTRKIIGQGYHPDLTKSILIVRQENLETGKVFGARHRFRVCTGARYLGGYIGDDNSKRDWMRECTQTWEKNISTISKTADKYTQESYAAVVHEIQLKLIFL